MNPNSILIEILKDQFNSNYYKKLSDYYKGLNKINEASAIVELINFKYGKPSNPDTCEKS